MVNQPSSLLTLCHKDRYNERTQEIKVGVDVLAQATTRTHKGKWEIKCKGHEYEYNSNDLKKIQPRQANVNRQAVLKEKKTEKRTFSPYDPALRFLSNFLMFWTWPPALHRKNEPKQKKENPPQTGDKKNLACVIKKRNRKSGSVGKVAKYASLCFHTNNPSTPSPSSYTVQYIVMHCVHLFYYVFL